MSPRIHVNNCRCVCTWVCLKIGYTPNYSHLIGIMISKTIGFRGTQHFQTNPHGCAWMRVSFWMKRNQVFAVVCLTWSRSLSMFGRVPKPPRQGRCKATQTFACHGYQNLGSKPKISLFCLPHDPKDYQLQKKTKSINEPRFRIAINRDEFLSSRRLTFFPSTSYILANDQPGIWDPKTLDCWNLEGLYAF